MAYARLGERCVCARRTYDSRAVREDALHTRRFRTIRSLPIAIVLCALATACGSGAAPAAAPTPSPAADAPGPTSPAAAASSKPSGPELNAGPGVSPAQLRRAEALLASTIETLPRWTSPEQAYADGYRSIGDTASVVEHYVNWSYVADRHILDPRRPESIVYQRRGEKQVAVAAMYSLPIGSTFADVPDVGGALTQWHVHNNLCLTDDPVEKIILRYTATDGSCPEGSSKASDTPMLHVWTVPNPCGPFASLEFGGQFPEGETRRCDTHNADVHAHNSKAAATSALRHPRVGTPTVRASGSASG
jgi:hypothetical protein